MKKVIFLSTSRITKWDYHRYGCDYLEKNEYDVFVWLICCTEKVIDINCSAKEYVDENCILFSYSQFIKEIKKNRDAIFIVLRCTESGRLYIALNKYKCKYLAYAEFGPVPYKSRSMMSQIKENKNDFSLSNIYKRMKRKGIRLVIKSNLQRLYSFYEERVKPFAIKRTPPIAVVVSTKYSETQIPFYLRSFPLIHVPAFDYNTYLEVEQKGEEKKEDIILFCDSGLGFRCLGMREEYYQDEIYKIKDKYFRQIEIVLKNLERYYHAPVVIAGHPHAVYDVDAFGGRTIVYNKTAELTKKCKVFVFNVTTAVSFPVLYEKKVLTLYNDSFQKSEIWNTIGLPMMENLGLVGGNMDRQDVLDKPWKYVETVGENVRYSYIEKCLKDSDIPIDRSLAETIAQFLSDV